MYGDDDAVAALAVAVRMSYKMSLGIDIMSFSWAHKAYQTANSITNSQLKLKSFSKVIQFSPRSAK